MPSGENIAVELTFDAELLQVTMTYDSDIGQNGELFHFGPIPFSSRFEETQEFLVTASAYELGEMSALNLLFTVLTTVRQLGDINRDGMIDARGHEQGPRAASIVSDPIGSLSFLLAFTSTCQYILALWMAFSPNPLNGERLTESLKKVLDQISRCDFANRPGRREPRIVKRSPRPCRLMQHPGTNGDNACADAAHEETSGTTVPFRSDLSVRSTIW